MTTFNHETVLLHETVDGLNLKPNGIYVDCTLGGAGHSEYLLSQLGKEGHLYVCQRICCCLSYSSWHISHCIMHNTMFNINRIIMCCDMI